MTLYTKDKYKKVKCKLCGNSFYRITNTHLWKSHHMSMDDYHKMFPGELVEDPNLAHDRVEHLRHKSYEDIYGKEKSDELKKSRRNSTINQMKDDDQINLRKNISILPMSDESKYVSSLVHEKSGISTYNKKGLEYYGEECMRCGSTEDLVVHHINTIRDDNNLNNLMVLCRKCHSKLHNETKPGKFVGISSIEKGAIYILKGLKEEFGLDLNDVNFHDTPKRVARAYYEICEGINAKEEVNSILSTAFPSEYDGMVTEGPIRCYSLCPHHLLPVIYDVYIGYIPGEGCLGLSKLPRLVELLSKGPKLQESFTHEIVDNLDKTIHPRGCMVVVKGEHMCMAMRGVKASGCKTTTSAIKGNFEDQSVRDEFLSLTGLK